MVKGRQEPGEALHLSLPHASRPSAPQHFECRWYDNINTCSPVTGDHTCGMADDRDTAADATYLIHLTLTDAHAHPLDNKHTTELIRTPTPPHMQGCLPQRCQSPASRALRPWAQGACIVPLGSAPASRAGRSPLTSRTVAAGANACALSARREPPAGSPRPANPQRFVRALNAAARCPPRPPPPRPGARRGARRARRGPPAQRAPPRPPAPARPPAMAAVRACSAPTQQVSLGRARKPGGPTGRPGAPSATASMQMSDNQAAAQLPRT